MNSPPRSYRLAVVVAAAVAAAAVWLSLRADARGMSVTSWLVAAELTVALAIGRLAPVSLAKRTLHMVGTTGFLLAALLLPLPVAMIGVVVICLATDLTRRTVGADGGRLRWYDTTYNSAQYVLRIGAGALVFRAISGTELLSGRMTDRGLAAVVLAGAAMYLTNIALVYAIVSIGTGRWQYAALLRLVRINLPQEGSLLLLGVLGAMIAGPAPLLIALPLLATIIIYRELALQRTDTPIELIRDDERQSAPIAVLEPVSILAFWNGAC
jgi:hypothetical protein